MSKVLVERFIFPGTLFVIGVLAVFELLVISRVYGQAFDFECRAVLPAFFCETLSKSVMRALGIVACVALLLGVRPVILSSLLTPSERNARWVWVSVQLAGFFLVLAPASFMSNSINPVGLYLGVGAWIVGGSLACVCTAGAIAPFSAWRRAVAVAGLPLLFMVGVGAILPNLTLRFDAIWKFEPLARLTFAAVHQTLSIAGYAVESKPEVYTIGAGEFFVAIGPPCSGIEGFALIALFLGIFYVVFRDNLRFPQALILLPIGLAMSWCMNVLRISLLITIGIEGAPDLAVDGFHSHAGWLMFTVLSVALVIAGSRFPWLLRDQSMANKAVDQSHDEEISPIWRDPVVAMILPFTVFMGSALLANTFSATPALFYPLRAIAVAATLALFWRVYFMLPWRCNPIAIGAGLVCGVLWVATAAPAGTGDWSLSAQLAALPTALLAFWIACRLAGTILLVPLLEELFFRGYLFSRLNRGGLVWAFVALTVTSLAFGALHDRWLAGSMAGLLFGLVYLRRRNLSDAIVSHASANAVVAVVALMRGEWHLI